MFTCLYHLYPRRDLTSEHLNSLCIYTKQCTKDHFSSKNSLQSHNCLDILTSTFDKFQYGFVCWFLMAHHWYIFRFGIDFPSIMFQSWKHWFCGNIGLVPLGHVVCSKNVGYKCSLSWWELLTFQVFLAE